MKRAFERIADSVIIVSILSIILGIFLLSKHDNAVVLLTIAFGLWMMVYSINNIKIALFFRKNVKDKEKLLKDKIAKIIPMFE